MEPLFLYTRQGCCLCEGLEQRLRELLPPLDLRVVDVDRDPLLQARFDQSVPVLAQTAPLNGPDGPRIQLLPPVPPRLRGERLKAWLVNHITP